MFAHRHLRLPLRIPGVPAPDASWPAGLRQNGRNAHLGGIAGRWWGALPDFGLLHSSTVRQSQALPISSSERLAVERTVKQLHMSFTSPEFTPVRSRVQWSQRWGSWLTRIVDFSTAESENDARSLARRSVQDNVTWLGSETPSRPSSDCTA